VCNPGLDYQKHAGYAPLCRPTICLVASGIACRATDASTGKQLTTTQQHSFISPQVNLSHFGESAFGNEDGKLRDGQYVRARIIWNQKLAL